MKPKTKKTKPHFSQHLNPKNPPHPKPPAPPAQPKPSNTIPLNAPKDWQADFRRFSFRTNFALNLTQTMLEFLCATADDVVWDRSLFPNIHAPDNWLATEVALQKRGLIRRKPDPDRQIASVLRDAAQPRSRRIDASFCELTPAGEAIVQLFKATGIFVQADAAIYAPAKRRNLKQWERRQAKKKA